MQSTTVDPRLPIPNLLQAFATIPAPRTRRGRRYSLAALLTIAVAGILANHTSVLAIAEWAASLRGHARTRLGLRPGMTPHQTTFARLFRRIDPAALTIALTHAFDPRRPTVLPPVGARASPWTAKPIAGAGPWPQPAAPPFMPSASSITSGA